MDYEHGMQIIWDVVTRTIVVIFRGEVVSPPERFNSRIDAIAAGEQVCRNLGWGERSIRKPGETMPDRLSSARSI